jgi:hypothetical protein
MSIGLVRPKIGEIRDRPDTCNTKLPDDLVARLLSLNTPRTPPSVDENENVPSLQDLKKYEKLDAVGRCM